MVKYKFGSITVSYNSAHLSEIMGVATDREFKFGHYFPVDLQHKKFHLQLYYIVWEDKTMELHPRVINGGENIQTLHGRLRLSIDLINSGRYRRQYVFSLRRALLKGGVTLHSNLFGASLHDLDSATGYDTYQTLLNFGATEVGTKEELLDEDGNRRNDYCCIFRKEEYDVAIAGFLITRVIPINKNQFAY